MSDFPDSYFVTRLVVAQVTYAQLYGACSVTQEARACMGRAQV